MLSLKQISKSFGDKPVLSRADFDLSGSAVIGLVGPNGAGKTTLLKVAAGLLSADSGEVLLGKERVGYLPQHHEFGKATVAQYLAEVAANAPVGKGLAHVSLEVPPETPAASLSGGQKTRLALAALLLQKPTILLLDEPTNNLDGSGIEWLTSFIKSFKGAVLVVSHDRAFLDEVTDHTIELKEGKTTLYGGNYSSYREQLQAAKQSQLETFQNQEKYKKRLVQNIAAKKADNVRIQGETTNYLVRAHAAKLARQAKAYEARLRKEMAAVDWVEKPLDRVRYKVEFVGSSHANKLIVRVENLSKAFDTQAVLSDLSLEVFGPEHVQIAGANGSGKTTLLKILAGQLRPDEGEVHLGEGIKVGFFTQEATGLDLNKIGIQELLATGQVRDKCFRMAATLHLEAEALQKPIRELSRGQIAKLEFTKLLLQQNDLLLLDEPTNHLEIETREDIEQALQNYRGAVILASHDRYFLEQSGIDRIIYL